MCKIQIRKIKLNRSTKFYVVRVDSGLRRKRGREQEAKTGKLEPVFTVRMRIIDHDNNQNQDHDQDKNHDQDHYQGHDHYQDHDFNQKAKKNRIRIIKQKLGSSSQYSL